MMAIESISAQMSLSVSRKDWPVSCATWLNYSWDDSWVLWLTLSLSGIWSCSDGIIIEYAYSGDLKVRRLTCWWFYWDRTTSWGSCSLAPLLWMEAAEPWMEPASDGCLSEVSVLIACRMSSGRSVVVRAAYRGYSNSGSLSTWAWGKYCSWIPPGKL